MDLFQDSDMESDVEMEDMRGIAQGMGRKKKKKTSIGSPSRLVVVLIAIVCLIIVFAVFANVGDKVTVEDINPLMGRLDKLEKNIANHEEIKSNIAQLTKQIKTLQESMASLEQNGSSISKELGKVNKQLVLLKSKSAPVSAPNKAATPAVAVEKKSIVENKVIAEKKPAVEKKAAPQPKRVYHDVKQGETLFAIARQYGVTIDDLYSLNKLSENNPISPGQKIIVK